VRGKVGEEKRVVGENVDVRSRRQTAPFKTWI